jgi:hypothetical protein
MTAQALIDALAARGIALRVYGRKLMVLPKSAFATLSVEERQALKQNKDDIIAVVRAGPPVLVASTAAAEDVQPTPVPAPALCPFCRRAPCVGKDHPSYDFFHQDDDEHIAARNEQATKEMKHQLQRGGMLPDWYRR